MPSPQTFTYKSADGCDLKLDLHLPESQGTPAVLFWLHGGALIGGNRKDIKPEQLDFYLNNGFAVASPDYRLAPETKLPGIIEDIQDAYAWLRNEGCPLFQLDSRRIAVIGHSAGGYLTLMAGFCLSPRPRALASFYGYGDIVGGWYSRPDPFYCKSPAVTREDALASVGKQPVADLTTDYAKANSGTRFPFYLYCRQNGLWPQHVSGFDPETERGKFVPFSPLWNVSPEYPPTLLLHGDIDTDVPYAQSVLMAYELQRHGVEHELFTSVGGGHGFDGWGLDKPEVARAFQRVLSFLQTHL